jgi:hypothetical protein
MILDVDIVYIKLVAHNEIYKFVVDNFFTWDSLEAQIFVLNYHILKFNFWNFLVTSDEETFCTKAVLSEI